MEGSEGWWILIYFQEQCTLIVPSETEGPSPPFARGFALGNVFHYRAWTEPCMKVYQLAKLATQKYSPFAGSGSYTGSHGGKDA